MDLPWSRLARIECMEKKDPFTLPEPPYTQVPGSVPCTMDQMGWYGAPRPGSPEGTLGPGPQAFQATMTDHNRAPYDKALPHSRPGLALQQTLPGKPEQVIKGNKILSFVGLKMPGILQDNFNSHQYPLYRFAKTWHHLRPELR
jgi:hypothetical protein